MKTPWWFLHKTPISYIFLPFSWIYYCIGRFVWQIRKIGAISSERPVICIGNILAGGVGKTPIVRQIAKFLDAPVVMRGYKKSDKTCGVGDEALMLISDDIQVHTGDRKSNVLLLNRQKANNVPIVMDDGFQNPSIKKDISILVFDEAIGLGNGFLLPAGPLRETNKAMLRADAIIVIKSNNKSNKLLTLPIDVPNFFAVNKTISPYSNKQKLFAFAGIGYPHKFFKSLENVIGTKKFPDHYQYTDNDIKKMLIYADKKDAKLVTTKKDWVRLPDWAREKIKYAELETKIDDKFFKWLKERLNDNIKTKC